MADSQLRILHMIETGGPGGAEAMFGDLVHDLDRSRFQSEVALLRSGGWLEGRLLQVGIQPNFLRSGGRIDIGLIRNTVRLVREKHINLIHSHLMDMNFYACLAGVLARVPVVATEHGDVHHPSKEGKINRLKPKAIHRFSSCWVCVSEFTRRELARKYGIPVEMVRVIYNGIRVPELPTEERKADTVAGVELPEGAVVIGSVGSLYPVKGHVYLIEAMKSIVQEIPSAHLAVAGRGNEESRLRQKAAEVGIPDHVHLLGLRNDVPDLLRAFDVFVLPSLSEGLPLSLLEAMAASRVVVASKVGGIPEVIHEGLNGFMVEPKDVEGLAKRIIHVLRIGDERNRIGLQARRTIETRFSVEKMVSEYQQVYSEFGGGRRRKGGIE